MKLLLLGKPLSPCEEQYQEAFLSSSSDRYIPHCTPGGNYFPIQCDASVCFCVDQQGVEIEKTAKLLPETPVCNTTEGV